MFARTFGRKPNVVPEHDVVVEEPLPTAVGHPVEGKPFVLKTG